MEIIAEIRLARGQVGYYDEYSRIHLTMGAPTAYVYAGTNCAQLRRSVKSGRIEVVHGSLGRDVPMLTTIRKNGMRVLASNAKEEHKPVYIVKEEEVAPSYDAEDVVKAVEYLSEVPKDESKMEEIPEGVEVSEEVPKRMTRRKTASKK